MSQWDCYINECSVLVCFINQYYVLTMKWRVLYVNRVWSQHSQLSFSFFIIIIIIIIINIIIINIIIITNIIIIITTTTIIITVLLLLLLLLLLLYECLLSQAYSSWYFSWTSGDPHRLGFKLHTVVIIIIIIFIITTTATTIIYNNYYYHHYYHHQHYYYYYYYYYYLIFKASPVSHLDIAGWGASGCIKIFPIPRRSIRTGKKPVNKRIPGTSYKA